MSAVANTKTTVTIHTYRLSITSPYATPIRNMLHFCARYVPHAASAGLTRFVISPPFSRSTSAMSYWLCKSSQNCALLPK